jgi:hypothetical protein
LTAMPAVSDPEFPTIGSGTCQIDDSAGYGLSRQ